MMEGAPAQVETGELLTINEEKRLKELETTIATELIGAFYEVGKALTEIRDNRLYRAKSRTFEGYCRQVFELAKTRAYELIKAALVYDDLSANGGQKILPANERQIRPLLRISDKETRAGLWQAAVGTALNSKKGTVSGGLVAQVVKGYLGEVADVRLKTIKQRVPASRQLNADLKKAFDLLTEEIRKAMAEGYRSAPRQAIASIIDGLRRLIAEDGDLIPEPKISLTNREKLLRAGYVFFRCNRQSLVIEKEDSSHFDWQLVSNHKTMEELDQALADLLSSNEKHLQG